MTGGENAGTGDSQAISPGAPLLEIRGLRVRFPRQGGAVTVVDDVDLSINQGEILGLVGESGSGKTMVARSILRLVPPPGEIVSGTIHLEGVDLAKLDEAGMRKIRGDQISVILQEPMTSLNPAFTVGDQILEVLKAHRPRLSGEQRKALVLRLMDRVGISRSAERLRQYPHELSGGLRQRIMIAMALICGDVRLLIADEPTTALDVTIQAQILGLFVELQEDTDLAILLITHDLGVVAQTAHRVAVMYAGTIVEIADVFSLFDTPLHPYTQGLLASLPRRGRGVAKSRLPSIAGTVPNPDDFGPGCRFYDRCPHRIEDPCKTVRPELNNLGSARFVRCHRWQEIPEFKAGALS